MKNNKILHLQLVDSFENKETLICRIVEGQVKYSFYKGWGDSGLKYSLSNIDFFEKVEGGKIKWLDNTSLPISNYEGETLKEFKKRITNMIKNSTRTIVSVVNNKVEFVNC